MMLGVVGRPGCPYSPLDLPVEQYLWFVEGLIREMSADNHKVMNDLHAPKKSKPVAADPEVRGAQINDFLAAVLG